MRSARREQAKIRTSAGEAGLSLNSGSIESLLMDSAMQMELQGDRTIANMESRHQANTAEAASMLSQIQKPTALGARSEEHTSELQSLMRNSYAVFCLKKQNTQIHKTIKPLILNNKYTITIKI